MPHSAQPKVALLVHACDRYEFLYEGFAFFFAKYWNAGAPCTCYFATEEKTASLPGFRNIQSGRGEWSDRLAVLLKQIPEDYILYFQEDMWLTMPTNPAFFAQLFALSRTNDWKLVKLHSADVYRTMPTEHEVEGFRVARLDNQQSRFLMSHQVSLWNKAFLLQQLPPGEHPWRNERKGTKRLKKMDPAIYQVDYFAENGYPAINANPGPVLRSEYRTISVNSTLNHNITGFIEELRAAGGPYEAYALRLAHNYRNQLTHDGKEKPRKEDVFKRLKKWVGKRLGA